MSTSSGRTVAVLLVSATMLLGACSTDEGSTEDGWLRISPAELSQMLEDREVVLVNVHVPYEGEIPGTDSFIPYTELASRLEELPPDATSLVIYCRSGNMSTTAAGELVAAGYSGFAELEGGFETWREAGLPFEA